ncbi:ubiquinone biosynthesis protein COQ7-domain-containing protein [Dipodascopsis tothii]|uniref:ubiquinone biosynthesis protein COQ7-domain-containing protein n=1 Tax=Dipodascopsis tothii TaxID=44089 RepID=UPI0034CEF6D9
MIRTGNRIGVHARRTVVCVRAARGKATASEPEAGKKPRAKKTEAGAKAGQTEAAASSASKAAEPAREPAAAEPTLREPLTAAQRAFLDRTIRVDQAGELGADYIYAGQHAVFKRTRPELAPLIHEMWQQEVHHHKTFNALQTRHRVRPSLLSPVWKVAATALGVGTALMGKEAAMACTVAVETVIGGHYNDQLRELYKIDAVRDAATGAPSELGALAASVRQFRDDELEHLDTAVENDADKAVPYTLLTEAIKGGCRAAIWVAERV